MRASARSGMTSHAISRTTFSEICATTRWAIVSTMSFGTTTSPAIELAAGAAAGVRSAKELAGAAGADGGVGGGLTLHLGEDTCDGTGLDGAAGGGAGAAARGGGGTGAVVRGDETSGALKARVPASASSAAWNEKLAVPPGAGGGRGISS